jgi:hypothetical protein
VPAASRYPGEIVNTYGASAELFSLNSVVPGRNIGIPCSPTVNGVRFIEPAAVAPGIFCAASMMAFFCPIGASVLIRTRRSMQTGRQIYFGVSFNNLLVAGVLSSITAVPLSVST